MAQLAAVSKDDIVIAVMGYIGCGKTNFIAKACGSGTEHVNSSVIPQNPDLRTFTTTHPSGGRRVVFVDTPGFDNPTVSDAETVSLIADWLIELQKQQARVRGVLYLHSITNNRISSAALKNIQTFVRICGAKAMPNVVLVTTMWDTRVDKDMATNREEELKRVFWKGMLADGGSVRRFMNTKESAWEVLRALPDAPVTLQMDEELQERGNDACQTEAYQHANSTSSSISRWIHDITDALFKKSRSK